MEEVEVTEPSICGWSKPLFGCRGTALLACWQRLEEAVTHGTMDDVGGRGDTELDR